MVRSGISNKEPQFRIRDHLSTNCTDLVFPLVRPPDPGDEQGITMENLGHCKQTGQNHWAVGTSASCALHLIMVDGADFCKFLHPPEDHEELR